MATPKLTDDIASLRLEDESVSSGPRRWPWVLLVLIILGLGGFYTWRLRERWSAIEVTTTRPTLMTANQRGTNPGAPILTASGYLVARRKAVVSAKIQGRLSKLNVEEGSRVREGDVIARLESSDYEAQVQRARAAVQHAQADLQEYQRQLHISEKLAAAKVSSQDALDAARSRVNLAQAAVSQAKADEGYAAAQLQNTYIRAPFTGVVVKKMAEVGESVAPIPPGVNISTSSGAIVALAALDTLEMEADVNEANVAQLGNRQPAEVTVEAIPDRTYKAVLRQIIPTADRTKATVQVKVTILDKDKDLKPEMSSKVTFLERNAATRKNQISSSTAPILTVPSGVVVSRNGKSVVFEVVNDRAQAREVVAGPAWKGRATVKQGLTGSEILISDPPESLLDGNKVRIKS
jgi:RND family efflux transporter MFP subunit